MTTVNIKFIYAGDFATFIRLVGRSSDDRSWGLSHELSSGKHSDELIKGIQRNGDGLIQMEWEGETKDIAEAMINL